MRQIALIVFGWLLLASVAQADTGNDPLLAGMAMETKTAILNYDNKFILQYVPEEGIVFEGRLYAKEQIIDLLEDKRSWLFKYLYSGKSSIRSFFDQAQDVAVEIKQRSENAVMVTYAAKNTNEKRTLENCYISINGTWYLEGIFKCE